MRPCYNFRRRWRTDTGILTLFAIHSSLPPSLPEHTERGDQALSQLPGRSREGGETEGARAGLSPHSRGGAAVGQEGGTVAH